MSGDSGTSVFLSVIAWPEGVSRRDAGAIVLDALERTGFDDAITPETLRLRLAIEPPMVLGLVPREAGIAVSNAIASAGGDAFAPSPDDLLALGPTLKIRDLDVSHGGVDVVLWRGGEARIEFSRIASLVRAHLSDTVVVRTPASARMHPLYIPGPRFSIRVRADFVQDAAQRRSTTSDKLDIHTTDGRVFQLDGDKFGYRALGDMRGHSDKQNMDRMFELLQHLASDAVADMYFSLWKPPPHHDRLRIPGARLNNDDPAFAFYSRWAALMYRHILGGA